VAVMMASAERVGDGFGLSLSSQFLEAGEMVSADLEETAEDLILLVSRDTQRVVI